MNKPKHIVDRLLEDDPKDEIMRLPSLYIFQPPLNTTASMIKSGRVKLVVHYEENPPPDEPYDEVNIALYVSVEGTEDWIDAQMVSYLIDSSAEVEKLESFLKEVIDTVYDHAIEDPSDPALLGALLKAVNAAGYAHGLNTE